MFSLSLEAMGLDHDWGYSTRNFCALKKNYGTSVEFKQLIDECHRRQIRIIIDAVFNHTADDCPLQMIDHNYWVRSFSIHLLFSKSLHFSITKRNIIQTVCHH